MKFSGSVKFKHGPGRFQAFTKVSDEAMLNFIKEATLEIHANAVRGIMKRSNGETQVRYNPRRIAVASKPGDPPNVDLGTFVRSVQFDVDDIKFVGVVGTNDKRGPWFEFGTKTMEPRPWLGPAWKEAQRRIKSMLRALKFKVD